MALVWVRILGKQGNSEGIVLPSDALRALRWERGDRLLVRVYDEHEIRITKFEPHLVPKRVRDALMPKTIT